MRGAGGDSMSLAVKTGVMVELRFRRCGAGLEVLVTNSEEPRRVCESAPHVAFIEELLLAEHVDASLR